MGVSPRSALKCEPCARLSPPEPAAPAARRRRPSGEIEYGTAYGFGQQLLVEQRARAGGILCPVPASDVIGGRTAPAGAGQHPSTRAFPSLRSNAARRHLSMAQFVGYPILARWPGRGAEQGDPLGERDLHARLRALEDAGGRFVQGVRRRGRAPAGSDRVWTADVSGSSPRWGSRCGANDVHGFAPERHDRPVGFATPNPCGLLAVMTSAARRSGNARRCGGPVRARVCALRHPSAHLRRDFQARSAADCGLMSLSPLAAEAPAPSAASSSTSAAEAVAF